MTIRADRVNDETLSQHPIAQRLVSIGIQKHGRKELRNKIVQSLRQRSTVGQAPLLHGHGGYCRASPDRKSTRLNSSHMSISYAVFCLKKKKKKHTQT